ncbi:MAG: hypothetical protein U0793_18915 [Gemmataceae bacterium]
MAKLVANPYKPGAGHSPPHLAGRKKEAAEFRKFLAQETVSQNVVLTGLRGVGKTVLMDDVYKPLAIQEGWIWVGSDFSESAFVDEKALCHRLLTDLSLFTATLSISRSERSMTLHRPRRDVVERLDYDYLVSFLERQPGLMVDKLKATLEFVWKAVPATGKRGIIFAYDEAQVVQDRRDKDQYPLALLLEAFQSLQRKGMRYMLLLAGLPTLFPKLVESRTYAERMFTVQEIGRLDPAAADEAITKPLEKNNWSFSAEAIRAIAESSGRYPYFIQFICRESFDHFRLHFEEGRHGPPPSIPMATLILKLDADFFAGRWGKATDRQRELLYCVARLPHAAEEFTVSEIVAISRKIGGLKPFKAADVSQILPKLIDAGLIYKNRYGKYSLAVPLFDGYITRQFVAAKAAPH